MTVCMYRDIHTTTLYYQTCNSLNLYSYFSTYQFVILHSLSPDSIISNIYILNSLSYFYPLLLLLILQSLDWLAAFHLELLQAILFIAV